MRKLAILLILMISMGWAGPLRAQDGVAPYALDVFPLPQLVLITSENAHRLVFLGQLERPASFGVEGLAFNSAGTLLAVAAEHFGVDIWNLEYGEVATHFEFEGDLALDVAFAPQNAILAVTGLNIHFWDVQSEGKTHPFDSECDPTGKQTVAFSQNGALIAYGGQQIEICQLRTGERIFMRSDTDARVAQMLFDPNLTYLAIEYESRRVELWDFAEDALLWSSRSRHLVAFDHEGNLFTFDPNEQMVSLWRAETQIDTALFTLPIHSGYFVSAGNVEGNVLAIADRYDMLAVWSWTGEELIDIDTANVGALASSPDGRLLVSGHGTGGLQGLSLWGVLAPHATTPGQDAGLRIGEHAMLIGSESQPPLLCPSLADISEGCGYVSSTQVTLLEGPAFASGHAWWRVQLNDDNNTQGWVREREGNWLILIPSETEP